MQTDDMIARLAEDLAPRWSLRRVYATGLVIGTVVAAALLCWSSSCRSGDQVQ